MLRPFDGSFEDFAMMICRDAEEELGRQRPGDDPPPMLYAYRRMDSGFVALPLPPECMNDRQTKYALGTQVMRPIVAAGATFLALMTAAWKAEAGTPAGDHIMGLMKRGQPLPSFEEVSRTRPGVTEELIVHVMSRERTQLWLARVVRDGVRPRALAWDTSFETNYESHWGEAVEGHWWENGEDTPPAKVE